MTLCVRTFQRFPFNGGANTNGCRCLVEPSVVRPACESSHAFKVGKHTEVKSFLSQFSV